MHSVTNHRRRQNPRPDSSQHVGCGRQVPAGLCPLLRGIARFVGLCAALFLRQSVAAVRFKPKPPCSPSILKTGTLRTELWNPSTPNAHDHNQEQDFHGFI